MPDLDSAHARAAAALGAIAIVGDGRMGRSLVAALRGAGADVRGPLGRGATAHDADLVLLAVPDAEIAAAAHHIAAGRLVGHLSGATTLEPLAPHEALGIHPLMAVASDDASFAGVPAAVAGSSPRALEAAEALAQALGMTPFQIDDVDRAAYHAAASIASNFLVTLEGFADGLAATAGVPRTAFAPLVRATVENWQAQGAASALTGPIARGDDATVARQRAAVAERMPERLALFDALAAATRDLAATRASRPTGAPGAPATAATASTPATAADGSAPEEASW
ncbi:DUF2520 domain-containing protein [Microbacterium yannicii]|uniref:DUF2520 domain-containing protein n=1 Tax=Microbacterium yannicii TaxID=671622 RepID=A0ABP9MBQ0_9MICO|nr:Rossmann-like and DUF2520 domain-containing protein [Microbacterium yannicii]MCO5952594.1 DUF2520 domain-containing protein [Microbacterium yannicii]